MRPAIPLSLVVVLAALVASSVAQEPTDLGKRYFMDSGCHGCHVAERVIRLAPCPVLSVRQTKPEAGR